MTKCSKMPMIFRCVYLAAKFHLLTPSAGFELHVIHITYSSPNWGPLARDEAIRTSIVQMRAVEDTDQRPFN